MTRPRFLSTALLAAAIALSGQIAQAQSASSVTAAGGALLPSGASYGGVSLKSMKFGVGTLLSGGGVATGVVSTTLQGTTSKGKAQTITVEGKATNGSAQAGGAGTVSGTSTVDMGNGTAPLSGVPFVLTVSPGSGGAWSLLLKLGTTNLPAATVNAGSVTVR
jgi:hypothetical protein